MAAGYFLLLAQKKVTKENGTLGSAPLAQRAVRCGRTGFTHRPSMACCRNRRDPSRRPRAVHTAFSVRPSPRLRGDPGACPHPSPLPRAGEGTWCASTWKASASAAGTAALSLFPGPSRPRRAGAGIARRGARTMRARSTRAQGCAPGEPRSLLAKSLGHGCRATADARVSFLWLLSFGQAKESNRSPWMADQTTHGRESVLARTPKTKERKSKIKMDSGLRRNDGGRRIPAFAGMTEVEDSGLRRNDGGVGENKGAGKPAPQPSIKDSISPSSESAPR